MSDEVKSPFHSFSFTMIEDRRPRAHFRLSEVEDGLYELHVEKGSASNPSSQFTRKVPFEAAVRLRDSLQKLGVFGWEEHYGDTSAPGSLRWNVQTVFQEGVFSVASKGGSDVPDGFGGMLEELYRMDFPRPEASSKGSRGSESAGGMGNSTRSAGLGTALGMLGSAGFSGLGGLSAGDLGAYGAVGGLEGALGAAGIDFSQMESAFRESGLDSADMGSMLSEMHNNPAAFQQRMRDEFRHMPPDEQERMLDSLASIGIASRAWWERYLRG